MIGIVLVCFLLLFALVALTVTFGLKYVEEQRKKQVTTRLKTAVSESAVIETQILLTPEDQKRSFVARLLERFNLAQKMEDQIQQAGLTISLNTLLIEMVLLTIPGAFIGSRIPILMFPGPSALLFAFVAGILPYAYVLRCRRKRLAAFEEQFPEALDFLSRAMRAGHAFSISLEMLSEESPQPLGGEFRKVFNEHNLGMPIETALGNLAHRVPLLDVKFFVSSVLLQRETGGNLSEILSKLAYVIRERFKLKGQVKAASAHGRVTGAILSLMPIALMFGLLMVAPGYLQGMAADETGRYLIAGVIVAMILGHICIKKIVNIKV